MRLVRVVMLQNVTPKKFGKFLRVLKPGGARGRCPPSERCNRHSFVWTEDSHPGRRDVLSFRQPTNIGSGESRNQRQQFGLLRASRERLMRTVFGAGWSKLGLCRREVRRGRCGGAIQLRTPSGDTGGDIANAENEKAQVDQLLGLLCWRSGRDSNPRPPA